MLQQASMYLKVSKEYHVHLWHSLYGRQKCIWYRIWRQWKSLPSYTTEENGAMQRKEITDFHAMLKEIQAQKAAVEEYDKNWTGFMSRFQRQVKNFRVKKIYLKKNVCNLINLHHKRWVQCRETFWEWHETILFRSK